MHGFTHTDLKSYSFASSHSFLIASLDDEAQEDLRANKNLGVYKGALYENFIAEALVKQDFKLYYYSKENSTLEEDFFVRSTDELIPLEVKSNTHNSKSLSTLGLSLSSILSNLFLIFSARLKNDSP